jgi:hypothetical protein
MYSLPLVGSGAVRSTAVGVFSGEWGKRPSGAKSSITHFFIDPLCHGSIQ